MISLEINKTIDMIEEFYFNSFKLPTYRSLSKMSDLAEQLMLLLTSLDAGDMQKMNKYFLLTVEAMEKKDIVLIRDYLYYEIKPFLTALVADVETLAGV